MSVPCSYLRKTIDTTLDTYGAPLGPKTSLKEAKLAKLLNYGPFRGPYRQTMDRLEAKNS